VGVEFIKIEKRIEPNARLSADDARAWALRR
jgi:hypothetical protein